VQRKEEVRREKNRREENRTEQKRGEQNRTEQYSTVQYSTVQYSTEKEKRRYSSRVLHLKSFLICSNVSECLHRREGARSLTSFRNSAAYALISASFFEGCVSSANNVLTL
jgi:hypothetical protein